MQFFHNYRKWLEWLPRNFRHELLRRSFRLNYEWPFELEVKLATNASELESAFRLIHDSYVRAGYMDPDPTGLRVLPQHLMPQSAVIIALWDGKIVGTVTLLRENPMGLALHKTFGSSTLPTRGKRFGEITCMAIDPQFYKGLTRVFFPLIKFAYHFARDRFGVSHVFAAVHPSTVDFYQAILGMKLVPLEQTPYVSLKNAPALVLSAEVDHYLRILEELYDGHFSTTDLSRYFAAPEKKSQFKLPERDFHHVTDLVISPQTMNELFLGKADMSARLTREERRILALQYPHPNYTSLLDAPVGETRSEWRVETRFPAKVGLTRGISEIWDVSRSGLRLCSSEKLEVGGRVKLRIHLNRSVQAFLDAEVRWAFKDNVYGLKIESANSAWLSMVSALESKWDLIAGRPLNKQAT